MGTLPPNVKLEHKAWKGCVDLTFQHVKSEDLRFRLDGRLPAGYQVCPATPSAAVRATVAPLYSSAPFEPQIEAARAAFRAAEALLRVWPQIRIAAGFPTSDPVPA